MSNDKLKGDPMEQEWIVSTESDGVLELSIQRPEAKNALNIKMYRVLGQALGTAAKSQQIRAVLLSGTEDCFTAGNDLQDFMQNPEAQAADSPIAQFLWAFATFPKPIVLAIEGPAIGIGTTMLLHSDFAYASPTAQFKLPFTSLGLCPEFASSYLLPRLVGYTKASEWLMLGESISAQEACHWGLVNAVVEDPLKQARTVAGKLAVMPPVAMRKTKALLKASMLPAVQKTMVAEADAFVSLLQGQEFGDAVAAFFNRSGKNAS